MTRKEAGSFATKRDAGEKLDPRIAEAVQAKTVDNEFSCHHAEQLAGDLQAPMEKIGATLDLMGIRISRCQLGLFGYAPESRVVKPAPSIEPKIEEAIRQSLVNGRLPCLAVWAIAKNFGRPRMNVAEACEALKIKIKPCQLGAF